MFYLNCCNIGGAVVVAVVAVGVAVVVAVVVVAGVAVVVAVVVVRPDGFL